MFGYLLSSCVSSDKACINKKRHVDPRQFKQVIGRDRKVFKVRKGRNGNERSTDYSIARPRISRVCCLGLESQCKYRNGISPCGLKGRG